MEWNGVENELRDRMFRSIVLSACISSCLAVTCYDCYNTGPNHETCTRDRKCSGLACVIYDTGDDKKTMTAFCLLAMGGVKFNRTDSCWLDPDGPGRHCICYSDFCNHLIGSQLLLQARFLNRNPFLDYDDRVEKSKITGSDKSSSLDDAYREIEIAELRTVGIPNEDDLVPIDLSEYDRMLDQENSSSTSRPPSLVMMTLTLATSLARFIACI
ncbi:hypothetical protein Angca_000343 [Angiostrongylus cantonensis]|nr:hypothetical protein Angca_000343 [Angiostrongylus cantonensis]